MVAGVGESTPKRILFSGLGIIVICQDTHSSEKRSMGKDIGSTFAVLP